jgi:c-di-GMP-binding flagellar brake protein YcgR
VQLPNQYKSLPDSEQITAPAKVLRLLKRFAKRHTPLTVKVPGHKEHYTSYIVDVDGTNLLLDELLPTTGHQLLVTERALLLKGKLDGIVIQFFTRLKHVDDKDKLLTYHMELPGLLEYQQRRQNYRVRIPMTMRLPVIIEISSDKMVKGELHNLSHNGAGMILPADKSIMEPRSHHDCAIGLPDGAWIYCSVELRYLKDTPSQETRFLGVQFVGLLPMQSRLIDRCINELERELIRKRSAY